MADRNCIQCELFEFYLGSPGYGPDTPGTDARIECQKNHWSMDNVDNGGARRVFRMNILRAVDCSDFDPAKD